ncbi:hypothetical protein ACROYT_G022125 [Oculina patagonica]
MNTADLCDENADKLQLAKPMFKDYGGCSKFGGMIVTVKSFEDNKIVFETLRQPGNKRVLVVDGSGSLNRAMMGSLLTGLAFKRGWAGVVINGCIRDSEEIAEINVGVKALATMPRRAEKTGIGSQTEISVSFAGVTFTPGHYLYADTDGIVVSPTELPVPGPPPTDVLQLFEDAARD